MSLYHRICKYCDDKSFNSKPDFETDIILFNDGKKPTGTDVNGDRIIKWDTAKFGPQPTLSQLPKDAGAVAWCEAEVAKLKISKQAFTDASTVEELKAALLPDLINNKRFDDQV